MGLIAAPAYHEEPRYHAPIWRRLAAFVIDLLVVIVAFIPVSLALDAVGAASWVDKAGYFVWPAYFMLLWSRGATLGMHAMDLRLVGADFAVPTAGAVAVRWGAWTVLQLLLLLPPFWVLFLIYRLRKRPLWHDTVAKTYLLRTADLRALAPMPVAAGTT